ncbi:histidine phosphatase family protein [Schleiferilactobacillus perolens]|uniref:histidine phosphatase family protein n=1 Tax=Schleiferilactobacillus perolens TaxID=100468 RepID=UPI002356A2CC|nr:histidine phosphatase family protein [Schleiferilactobacillus perolens]MCI2170492.1 histidine phosphatase family protein [Schleiferilactobacillus perolens]
MTQTLYLMRHGETMFNQEHRVQGWVDSPLTEKGIRQAQIAGHYFTDNDITLGSAYCSTAERASDTLELVTDLPYHREKGLREWYFGRFEAQPEFLNPPLPYNDFFATYGGETQTQVTKRLSDTILHLMQHDHHRNILMVSHGGAIACFKRAWDQYAEHQYNGHFGNCSIMIFDFAEDKFSLKGAYIPDFTELDKEFSNR